MVNLHLFLVKNCIARHYFFLLNHFFKGASGLHKGLFWGSRSSFSPNVLEEIRHGRTHLQSSLINNSKSKKYFWVGCYRKQVISLECGFKNTSWSRISFTDVGTAKLLLVKCNQVLSNCIQKSSLFFFCKGLWLVDLRICFCLKRAKALIIIQN